jgi:hypothetical protein
MKIMKKKECKSRSKGIKKKKIKEAYQYCRGSCSLGFRSVRIESRCPVQSRETRV